MTVIPNFILKRMYKSGSFRQMSEDVAFEIVNNLGPGQISRINGVTLNGTVYGPEAITLLVGEDKLPGTGITEDNPATFFLNQTITCIIAAGGLEPGKYEIVLELISKEAGKVSLSVQDELTMA